MHPGILMYFAGMMKKRVTYSSPRTRKITKGRVDLQSYFLMFSNLFTYREQIFPISRCMKCSSMPVLNWINKFIVIIDSRLKRLQASLVWEQTKNASNALYLHFFSKWEHLCGSKQLSFRIIFIISNNAFHTLFLSPVYEFVMQLLPCKTLAFQWQQLSWIWF